MGTQFERGPYKTERERREMINNIITTTRDKDEKRKFMISKINKNYFACEKTHKIRVEDKTNVFFRGRGNTYLIPSFIHRIF